MNHDNENHSSHDESLNSNISVTKEQLSKFSEDVSDLWVVQQQSIPILPEPPDALTFLREYVTLSRPCIIRNAIPRPAAKDDDARPYFHLTLDDIVEHCQETQCADSKCFHVDVTPDGFGDCVRKVFNSDKSRDVSKKFECVSGGDDDQDKQCPIEDTATKTKKMFVTPHTEPMDIIQFRDALRKSQSYINSKYSDVDHSGGTNQSKLDDNGLEIFSLPSSTNSNNIHPNSHGRNEEEEDQAEEIRFDESAVFYYSRQNDCLRRELDDIFFNQESPLLQFPKSFIFAEEAFGTGPPDAQNLWIGNERAISSMHKDHYENLFYVCSGEKLFTVCPPSDSLFLQEEEFECGTFRHNHDTNASFYHRWTIDPTLELYDTDESSYSTNSHRTANDFRDDNNCTQSAGKNKPSKRPIYARWVEPDVEKILDSSEKQCIRRASSTSLPFNNNDSNRNTTKEDYMKKYPSLQYTHPFRIHVREGEMLYLPSLWFHRVTQSCETVGINYWYDMRFDSPQWCYFNFLQHLKFNKH